MASPDVITALSKLEDPSFPQGEKPSAYGAVLKTITASIPSPTAVPSLQAYIDGILSENLGIVTARPLLASAVSSIKPLPASADRITVGQHALQAIQSRVVSFEDQDASIREILADAYQAEEEWIESAKMLQGINLESSQRTINDDYRFRLHIRICRLYLEDEDTTTAESYLNRAKNLIHKVKDVQLNLEFRLSQARIFDSHRKFLDASTAYHTISFSPVLAEEERTKCLSAAITCAVLAPAGPQRSRTLAKLYKDDRAAQVEEFGILEKMFLDRLLSPEEVDRFASGLQPHQLATTADGTTVLAKAVVEHNLLAASRLYANIGIKELGVLLGCDAEKAEDYAAAMFEQGRLNGHIDQIDGVIFFHGTTTTGTTTETVADGGRLAGGIKVVGSDLRKWDGKVQGIAEEVERVASLLQSQYPDLATTTTNMAY